MIAALYVQAGGAYYGLPDVDPWDEARDARLYDGPYPAVAHPPCERWGRYWGGGPSVKVKRELGADGGCFAAGLRLRPRIPARVPSRHHALLAVRRARRAPAAAGWPESCWEIGL